MYESMDDMEGLRLLSVRLDVMDRVSDVMTWCARRLTLSRDLAQASGLLGVDVAFGLKLLLDAWRTAGGPMDERIVDGADF